MISEGIARVARRLGHRKAVAAVLRRLVPVDQWLNRVSGGRVSFTGITGVPGMVLTTTGAKTGLPRPVPLVYAMADGDYIVTASNWGQPSHPAWSANLMANPDATVQIGRCTVAVRAQLAEGPAREQLWSVVTRVWPAYDTYSARSGRDIRVFRLTPR